VLVIFGGFVLGCVLLAPIACGVCWERVCFFCLGGREGFLRSYDTRAVFQLSLIQ
jgi:hypothetical protein